MLIFLNVQGLSWGQCAISTARWKGVLLADILEYAGISYKDCRAKGLVHLRVEGLDAGPDGVGTGASIPLERAFDRSASVLVAFEMNGEEIPRDHGFPLRLVVPGTVGARNIKWLSKISVSAEESESPTQRRDYKLFGPNITNVKSIPWEQAPSVQYLPVTSAILEPSTGTRVEPGETVTLVRVNNVSWAQNFFLDFNEENKSIILSLFNVTDYSSKKQRDMRTQELEMVSQELTFLLTVV